MMRKNASSPVEVHFDLRTSDLYWLAFSSSIWKLTYARWIAATVLIVLVAVGLDRAPIVRLLLLLLFVTPALLVYTAIIRPYFSSRSFARATMGASPMLMCVIGPQGVDIHRGEARSHYDWEAVRYAKQTSSLVLIYFEGHSTLVIPKRCFENTRRLDDFRAVIAECAKFKARSRDSWR
jgi:YcxB-like protein